MQKLLYILMTFNHSFILFYNIFLVRNFWIFEIERKKLIFHSSKSNCFLHSHSLFIFHLKCLYYNSVCVLCEFFYFFLRKNIPFCWNFFLNFEYFSWKMNKNKQQSVTKNKKNEKESRKCEWLVFFIVAVDWFFNNHFLKVSSLEKVLKK